MPHFIVSLAGLTLACFAQSNLMRKGVPGGLVSPFFVLVLLFGGLLFAILGILTHLSTLILGLDSRTIRSHHCLTFSPVLLLWLYMASQGDSEDSIIALGTFELSLESIYYLLVSFLGILFGLIIMLLLSRRRKERQHSTRRWKSAGYLVLYAIAGFAAIVCGFRLYDHLLIVAVEKNLGNYKIDGGTRGVTARPIPSEFTIDLDVSADSILYSGFGVAGELFSHRSDAIACELVVSGQGESFRQLIDPLSEEPLQAEWFENSLALDPEGGSAIGLTMRAYRPQSSVFSDLLDSATYYLRILILPRSHFDIGHRAVFWINPSVVGRRQPGETNVILIGIDTLRADHLSLYGYTRDTSPFLEKFKETAVTFSNCRSGSPWTLPSFFSIMTSTYPSVHRYGTDILVKQFGMFPKGDRWTAGEIFPDYSIKTLAETLQKQGYSTAAFANNHFLAPEFEFDRGFMEFTEYEPTVRTGIDRVVRWIERHKEEKFFLFIHIMDPHDYVGDFIDEAWVGEKLKSFGKHTESKVQTDIDNYDSKIHLTDKHIGRLLDALDESLLDSTVIAVTADHGEEFMDHGAFKHGTTLYDEMLRVPLCIRLPGATRAGTVIEEPTSVLDVAPTILDILGLPIPSYYEGETLLPVIQGESLGPRPLFAENLSIALEKKAVTMFPHKMIYSTTTNTLELYDLEKDPKETRNIIGRIPEIESRMRQELSLFLLRSNRAVEVKLNPSPGQQAFEGRLTTKGAFVQVMPLSLENLDVFRTNAEANEIVFTLGPGDERRGFVFDVDPPDAAIRLELKQESGTPPTSVYLGSPMGIPRRSPVEFSKTALGQSDEIQPDDPKIEGIHIVHKGSRAKAKTVSIGDESKKALQALGYLK